MTPMFMLLIVLGVLLATLVVLLIYRSTLGPCSDVGTKSRWKFWPCGTRSRSLSGERQGQSSAGGIDVSG